VRNKKEKNERYYLSPLKSKQRAFIHFRYFLLKTKNQKKQEDESVDQISEEDDDVRSATTASTR